MKILLYGINYSPELTGIGKYTGEMAIWFSSRGHEVRVVTAPPYYPEWRVSFEYKSWHYKKEIQDGIIIWRCPIYVPTKPSGIKRLVHLLSFAITSIPIMLRNIFWRPDFVCVIEPTLMCAPFALITSQLSRAKAWLHIQDFEVDAAFNLGIIKADYLKSLIFKIESFLLRRFDLVSTISIGMYQKLIEKKVLQSKTILMMNWVNLNLIKYDVSLGQSMRLAFNLPSNTKIALYSGNIGEKQGLDVVINAARLLQNENIIFVIVGNGSAKSKLIESAKNLYNVYWFPIQPLEKLNALLNMADVHLLPQRMGVADLVMPSKLTAIFASERPVVAMAEPDTTVFNLLQDLGVIVPPEDARMFADSILKLLQDESESKRLGAAARKYAVENLCSDIILTKIETHLKRIL